MTKSPEAMLHNNVWAGYNDLRPLSKFKCATLKQTMCVTQQLRPVTLKPCKCVTLKQTVRVTPKPRPVTLQLG